MPGMTSTLEDISAKVCFMLEPKRYQSSKINKMTEQKQKRPPFSILNCNFDFQFLPFDFLKYSLSG
jgi:hypothetical protein